MCQTNQGGLPEQSLLRILLLGGLCELADRIGSRLRGFSGPPLAEHAAETGMPRVYQTADAAGRSAKS